MSHDNEILYNLLDKLGTKLDEALNQQARQHTEVIAIVATLQTQMKALVGNGQPGRITQIEVAVERLKAFRWKTLGVVTAISTGITMGIGLAGLLVKVIWHGKI